MPLGAMSKPPDSDPDARPEAHPTRYVRRGTVRRTVQRMVADRTGHRDKSIAGSAKAPNTDGRQAGAMCKTPLHLPLYDNEASRHAIGKTWDIGASLSLRPAIRKTGRI